MKRYFVTSDIHSYYSIFISELAKKGFDINNPDHYLIICGDLFDRGHEAKLLLDYLLRLQDLDRLIIIKGNHEALLEDCLEELEADAIISWHHWRNGTLDTIAQLSGIHPLDLEDSKYSKTDLNNSLKSYHKLISKALNYIEIDNYILVHGWIPHVRNYIDLKSCADEEWRRAAWANGMQEWRNGWVLPTKTIICGHWHCSFGNYQYHNIGSGEFECDSSFEPFIDEGIIALDACTAFSNKVNILILDIG